MIVEDKKVLSQRIAEIKSIRNLLKDEKIRRATFRLRRLIKEANRRTSPWEKDLKLAERFLRQKKSHFTCVIFVFSLVV